jgi:hypothetical protein
MNSEVPTNELETRRARLANEGRAGLVGSDHHHGLGRGRLQRRQARVDVDRVALVAALAGQRQAVLHQRAHHPRAAGVAVGIVLDEDADPLDAEVMRQALHHRLGLVEVRGAHVEHDAVHRVAQHLGPRERRHVRHARLGHQGQHRAGGRGADIAEQGEHLVLPDQLFGHLGRALRLVAVVVAHHLDAASMHAAGGVDPLEVGKRAFLELGTQRGRRAALGIAHADQDFAGSDSRFGARGNTAQRQENAQRQATDCSIHRLSLVLLPRACPSARFVSSSYRTSLRMSQHFRHRIP